MLFDIHGRFTLEVLPSTEGWRAYHRSNGLRVSERNLVIPRNLDESELERFLDDHFHEYALPGQGVRRVAT